MNYDIRLVLHSSRFFYDGDITPEFIEYLFRVNINMYPAGFPMNFFFKCSDKIKDKLSQIVGFVPFEKYPEPKAAFENEIGSFGSVRILLTKTQGPTEFVFFMTRGPFDRKNPLMELLEEK